MVEDTECLYSVMECELTDVHGALGSADISQVASHFQKESSISHHLRPPSSTLTWGPREKAKNSMELSLFPGILLFACGTGVFLSLVTPLWTT